LNIIPSFGFLILITQFFEAVPKMKEISKQDDFLVLARKMTLADYLYCSEHIFKLPVKDFFRVGVILSVGFR
jgi:hypothetical protein